MPGVTEVAGTSAAGKTQLCLQLSLTAQLPPQRGGLEAGTLASYVRTQWYEAILVCRHPGCVYVVSAILSHVPLQQLCVIFEHKMRPCEGSFQLCIESSVVLLIYLCIILYLRRDRVYLHRRRLPPQAAAAVGRGML